jgi:hypothetical protein
LYVIAAWRDVVYLVNITMFGIHTDSHQQQQQQRSYSIRFQLAFSDLRRRNAGESGFEPGTSLSPPAPRVFVVSK